jgi:hypothetical protein
MHNKQNVSFLTRCGLTLDRLAETARANGPQEANNPPSFSIRMVNDVKMSSVRRPSVPTARSHLELLRVELRDDLLTIADVKGQRRKGDGRPVEAHGARLYALKTIAMPGATTFMFLSEPPAGVNDDKFFPAEGTAVLYDNANTTRRVLQACGIDQSNGRSLSWIFNAVET